MTDTQLMQDPEKYIAQRQTFVSALFRLWTTSMPSDHVPTEDNFTGWLDTFGAELAATAIRKTANKARKEMRAHYPMNGRALEQYATATMKHLARETGIWK
jgi:hypothetical protein